MNKGIVPLSPTGSPRPTYLLAFDPRIASEKFIGIINVFHPRFSVFDRLELSIRTGKNLSEEGFVCSKNFDI
jgi:hypothetical protein